LRDFVLGFQAAHNVAGYGTPHFNLRYPFFWDGPEEELLRELEHTAAGLAPFRATLTGWEEFPTALYLGVRPTPAVLAAHEALYAAGGEPGLPGLDRDEYVPHVTVALCVLPWAREAIVRAAAHARVPRHWWLVSSLAVTRDNSGELIELARLPLGRPAGPQAAARPNRPAL